MRALSNTNVDTYKDAQGRRSRRGKSRLPMVLLMTCLFPPPWPDKAPKPQPWYRRGKNGKPARY